MTLYQRARYITPYGSVEIAPLASGAGALGPSLFTSAPGFTYNAYAGPAYFPLGQQGLVAFAAIDPVSPYGAYNDGGYRVVTKPDGSMDVLPFMEAMASLCSYGTADEALTQAQLLDLAKYRPVEMRCGLTTAFVRGCAPGVGVSTRRVHMLNVTKPNGFDDGHVALEAVVGGKWVLFDIPNDVAWTDEAGTLLSLADVVRASPANSTIRPLAQPRVGRSTYPGSTCWVSAFYEMQLRTFPAIQAWCDRIYEVPGMANGTGICWGVPASLWSYAGTIANYPGTSGTWTVMPLDQWVATYYP